MYDSAHFISSRDRSGYLGHPMPESYPDYPGHRQVLAYLRDVADGCGVSEHVRLGVEVENAEQDDDGRWQVRLSSGQTRSYRTLTCASGTQWHPSWPSIAGRFAGTLLHSSAYRHASIFDGRRVLVVGAGNSGVDIACDAAPRAARTVISLRRGYHLVPKHIFGVPADAFAAGGPQLPVRVAQAVLPRLLKIVNGDPTRHGWPAPDHRLFESHPIVNDQILHHLRHGDIAVRPGVARFDQDTVQFTDGTRESFDTVVMATGYRTEVPYLDRSCFTWKGNRPALYLRLWSPDHDGLAAIGFTEGDGGAYSLFDNMADAIARSARLLVDDPVAYGRFRRRIRGADPDVSGGVRYVPSDRHAAYVHLPAYRRELDRLRREFGWPPTQQLNLDRQVPQT